MADSGGQRLDYGQAFPHSDPEAAGKPCEKIAWLAFGREWGTEMRISFTDQIEGSSVLYPIGPVEAGSPWFGQADRETLQQKALQALIEQAHEIDADALIDIRYSETGVMMEDLAPVPLKRISAYGIAVRLAGR